VRRAEEGGKADNALCKAGIRSARKLLPMATCWNMLLNIVLSRLVYSPQEIQHTAAVGWEDAFETYKKNRTLPQLGLERTGSRRRILRGIWLTQPYEGGAHLAMQTTRI